MEASRAKLATFVVEDHNDALQHIFRRIGSKRLAFSGITLLHFDSHPDLLIPKDFKTADIRDIPKLYEALSIENWILPAVFAGHISCVVWVCPPWSSQIPVGSYNFFIGEDAKTGYIRTNSTLNYFIGELLYVPYEDLTNKVPLTLHVVQIGNIPDNLMVSLLQQQSQTDLNSDRAVCTSFALDIDLDFYSTKNPFRSIYTPYQYDLIKKLYKFTPPASQESKDLEQCCKERALQLKELGSYFAFLHQGQEKMDLTSHRLEVAEKLVRDIRSNGLPNCQEVDWLWLHEVGCGCDDTELPHHVSSTDEIHSLIQQTHSQLKDLPTPACITLARSSEDDYCPADQVDNIQSHVVDLLHSLYGELHLSEHYERAPKSTS